MPEGVVCASSGLLQLRCAVRVGIGAGSGSFLAERDCFITDSQQYADLETGRFFMRVVFQAGGARFPADTAALRAAFVPVAERFALDWGLVEAAAKARAIIPVPAGPHCPAGLLPRRRSGAPSLVSGRCGGTPGPPPSLNQ